MVLFNHIVVHCPRGKLTQKRTGNMPQTFRRVVTGNNAKGRSVVVEDVATPETGDAGNFNFWTTADGESQASFPFFPRGNDTLFRVFRIAPPPAGVSPAELEKIAAGFFAEVGDPLAKVDTSRHPFMHCTPTTDYIMLLSGQAALLFDEGEQVPLKPFDAVVQRATNHIWLNTGKEDAVFVGVMIGGRARDKR
jgi:hypothetical protein